METLDLFGPNTVQRNYPNAPTPTENQEELSQFFTPEWVGEELVALFMRKIREFGTKTPTCFCEPSCGKGAILKAIPNEFAAFGIELDPKIAEIARTRTNRTILTEDFRKAKLPDTPDAMIGNPPFQTKIFEGFLNRGKSLLPEGGMALFILPAYFFQTSSSTLRYNRDWTISTQFLPREIFPNLSKPIVVASFLREKRKRLIGFFLYPQVQEMTKLAKNLKGLASESKDTTPCWENIVKACLESLGGEANLSAIYQVAQPNYPTSNSHPKAKIRQTLQRGKKKGIFGKDSRGRWKHNPTPQSPTHATSTAHSRA